MVYTTSDISFSYRQRLYITQRIKRFVLVAASCFTDWLLHASLHTVVYFLIICSVCAEYEKIGHSSVHLNILRKCKSFYRVLKILNIVQ